jgi:hypothetical protein
MTEQQNNPNAFQLQVPVEELRKKKLFVATPMYGGQCAGMFARSALSRKPRQLSMH